MPFIANDYERKEYKKIDYLNLAKGTVVVRFIEDPATALVTQSHYVPSVRGSVTCSGEDCPICINNKKLIFEHPDDFRSQPGYSAKSTKYIINVLDRTSVKLCPSCKAENTPPYAHVCTSCNTFIGDVKAVKLDKVKILRLGNDLIHDLNNVENTICDEEGNPIGLMNFDIALITDGVGTKKHTTPVPSLAGNDVVNVPKELLFDKEGAVIKLTAEEIKEYLKGVTLKDIFAARKVAKAIEDVKEVASERPSALVDEVTSQIENLLN